MAREPDWFRLGWDVASGRKKSSMNLPDDFISSQAGKLLSDDFNVVKFAHDYATAWLETEQWRHEVGQKIQKFIKKYKDDDDKVDSFMARAYRWSDGYADSIISSFLGCWCFTEHNIRCKLTDKGIHSLIEQALCTDKDIKEAK